MSVIHMETELIEKMIFFLGDLSETIEEGSNTIYQRINFAAWQGESRNEYVQQVEQCRKNLFINCEELLTLQSVLRNEMNQWMEADATFASGVTGSGQSSFIIDAFHGFWGDIAGSFREYQLDRIWENADETKRTAMLLAFQTFIAASLHMPQIDLVVKDLEDPEGKDARGYYSTRADGSKYVAVDIDNVMENKPLDVLNTIAHENRHAMQEYLCDHPEKRPDDISIEQIDSWRENFENYTTPADDFEGYRKQPLEQDARDFASLAVDDFLQDGTGFDAVKQAGTI